MNDNIHIKPAKERKRQEAIEVSQVVIQVTGAVTAQNDKTGLPGVNVFVRGTSTGTITDVDGKYSINVPNDNDTLMFSSIGYVLQEVPVNGRSTIDVTLSEDIQSLDEVVVVGYGTRQRVI